MKLNLAKTACMWIGRKAWDEELKCGRTTLKICEQIKYLGLILMHNLKWDI